ncbi:3-oxoacyl-[acyl-carrier-protein] reductase [Desulfoprunum benzoelyticum]|uniref:3-oxoacyl-[acyl-carrier-protein] reductase n=1 Tax=Desulfoprunum benzoelyticum TaxID=1506996 RepID=A0A840V220_9BACT|nr:3-oxoacyl-[acyl-carrier-protein] reductase [Desulfoprunum benzoelyticum]MBB5348888.1 3-oxoacyl-[acyl-carrier protein] reductase [Desulfoprunum benzoelyticum]MBM9530125.1 3-oxoacyl-[acyl-carrier-protein] reductase [Desulfoprunum benzoelyticum]
MNLQGKIAVVTGGSRGIGRAISLRLAAMGAVVYINYVSRPDAAEETRRLIETSGGTARIIAFDVADGGQIQEAFKRIVSEAGRVDILVNNAGITRDGLLARMKESEWDQVLSTNLKGAFLCAKAVSKTMMKQRWGRIVNITSVIGFVGNAGQVNYAAAKAGLVGITKAMARELASRNITVNSVAPGYIQTEMTDALPEEARRQLLQEIPLASLGTPEDVAGAVAYLVSEDGRYLTGQTLHVNGGMFMQ